MLRSRAVTIAFLFVATSATFDEVSCCYYLAPNPDPDSNENNKFKSVWSKPLTKNAKENSANEWPILSEKKMLDETCWDQKKTREIWDRTRRHAYFKDIPKNATYMCCPWKKLTDGGRYSCFPTELTVGCSTSKWSAWGDCDKTCTKNRTRNIEAPWEDNTDCKDIEKTQCDNECDAGLGIFGFSTVATIFLILGTALVVIIIISIVVLMCCFAEKEEEEEDEDTGIDGDILFL